jgi:hypothetical protein
MRIQKKWIEDWLLGNAVDQPVYRIKTCGTGAVERLLYPFIGTKKTFNKLDALQQYGRIKWSNCDKQT